MQAKSATPAVTRIISSQVFELNTGIKLGIQCLSAPGELRAILNNDNHFSYELDRAYNIASNLGLGVEFFGGYVPLCKIIPFFNNPQAGKISFSGFSKDELYRFVDVIKEFLSKDSKFEEIIKVVNGMIEYLLLHHESSRGELSHNENKFKNF